MSIRQNNILLIQLLLIAASCTSKRNGYHFDNNPFKNSPVIVNASSKNNQYREYPFLLGKKIRITYSSYGCFHHTEVIVDVEENTNGYLIKVTNPYPNQPEQVFRSDLSFGVVLRDFLFDYKQLMENQTKKVAEDKYSFKTITKLTIQGGLQPLESFVSTAELAGFNNLVNKITSMQLE